MCHGKWWVNVVLDGIDNWLKDGFVRFDHYLQEGSRTGITVGLGYPLQRKAVLTGSFSWDKAVCARRLLRKLLVKALPGSYRKGRRLPTQRVRG